MPAEAGTASTMSPTVNHDSTVLPENNLDLLRAVAVLCVFVDHVTIAVHLSTAFTQWMGQAGVQAFFVHTSLVLMSSLERDGAPIRRGWVSRFYVRRTFRIYPLAWAVITVVILLQIPRGLATSWVPVTLGRGLSNYLLVQNLFGTWPVLAPLWTLPLELQMYAVLPFCFLVARLSSRKWMAVMIVTGIAMDVFFVWNQTTPRIPFMWRLSVMEFVPCFLMGVLSYWTLRRRRGARSPIAAGVWPLIIAVNLVVWSFGWLPGWHFLDRIFFCGVLGIAIPLVRDAAPSRFTRIAHQIAVYSYGIYLIHLLAIRVAFVVLEGRPVPVQVVVLIAVLTVSCFLAYHVIEKPGIALGQRLLRGRKGDVSLGKAAPVP